MEEKRAELIRQLKLCGASIVENAESIVSTEKRLTDVGAKKEFEKHPDLEGKNVIGIEITK